MDLTSIAVQGLDSAQDQLQSAATRLASAGSSPDGAGLDSVDLSAEVIALMSAKNDFSVNAVVLKTAIEVQKQAIDLLV